ncbi:helix-turn-helix domain-containing protein [Actinomadura hibisca]|uniref:helix-turn-helix domain-containing protein n=1 Tax=Actinomadura hibisca TaxID=68565 RepID=UPI000833923E|nr:helix-turn-helix transcriptional regulator [Actinomadura hibisca]
MHSPALIAFGAQMRRLRLAKNIKQAAIAKAVNVHDTYISKVENGYKRCNLVFVEKVDDYLEADGALIELWNNLNKEGHPVPLWFDWPEVEKDSVELTTWQHSIIPGLLQIEEYARAFFPEDKDASTRIERQALITRDENPVKYIALIKEEALYNLVVSKEVMRKQLEHLLEMSERPNVTIQIVANDGLPAGISGAFVLAMMEDRSEVVHLDTVIRGITTDDPADLRAIGNVLISLRGKALPVGMSRDLIRKALEKWT